LRRISAKVRKKLKGIHNSLDNNRRSLLIQIKETIFEIATGLWKES
jgi:hypothetical protein